MANIFAKMFGGGKKSSDADSSRAVVERNVQALLEHGKFSLQFDCKVEPSKEEENEKIIVDFYGDDEEILTEREGMLLDAFQLYTKRVLQHQMPDKTIDLIMDCDGFREEVNRSLIELADKLKGIALNKGKSVYFRALPPKDRKVIHQHLASDDRVKSRSIGDGLYKKIKIYPVGGRGPSRNSQNQKNA